MFRPFLIATVVLLAATTTANAAMNLILCDSVQAVHAFLDYLDSGNTSELPLKDVIKGFSGNPNGSCGPFVILAGTAVPLPETHPRKGGWESQIIEVPLNGTLYYTFRNPPREKV